MKFEDELNAHSILFKQLIPAEPSCIDYFLPEFLKSKYFANSE
jgi:hypothetical protein